MGFLFNKKGSILSDWFITIDNVGNILGGENIELSLYKDHLEVNPLSKHMDQTVSLNYNKITKVFHGKYTDIVDKNGDAIGGAIIGGLLFGGAGAIVGANAVGQKQVKSTDLMLIIGYTANDGIEQFLKFKDTRKYKGKKIAKTLREMTGASDQLFDRNVEL